MTNEQILKVCHYAYIGGWMASEDCDGEYTNVQQANNWYEFSKQVQKEIERQKKNG